MSSLQGSMPFRGPTGEGLGNKTPKGYSMGRIQNFTPQQMQLFQQLFSNVSPDSFTSRLAGGDQSAFEQMEAPALRQFGALQGNIASRFSGMGSGARRSSGFQNTQTQGASDFAQDLASRRQGLQRQALLDLMGLSEGLLNQRPYEQFLTKKPQSFFQSLLGGLAPALGQGLGNAIGTGGFGGGSSGSGGFLQSLMG